MRRKLITSFRCFFMLICIILVGVFLFKDYKNKLEHQLWQKQLYYRSVITDISKNIEDKKIISYHHIISNNVILSTDITSKLNKLLENCLQIRNQYSNKLSKNIFNNFNNNINQIDKYKQAVLEQKRLEEEKIQKASEQKIAKTNKKSSTKPKVKYKNALILDNRVIQIIFHNLYDTEKFQAIVDSSNAAADTFRNGVIFIADHRKDIKSLISADQVTICLNENQKTYYKVKHYRLKQLNKDMSTNWDTTCGANLFIGKLPGTILIQTCHPDQYNPIFMLFK